MKIFRTASSLHKYLHNQKNKSIGFVPTMGALHEGHLSLVKKSRRENKLTIVSIFVNPTQFGPKEDYAKYPRGEKKDKYMLQKEKVDILFLPSAEEMYPRNFLTYVEVKEYDTALCGKLRPGHFRGVATIVSKLLNIVQPTRLYLGQKDAQQVIILRKMITDLNFPIQVKIGPTKRTKDGLALSSRNSYLSTKQRKEAPYLYQALKEAKKSISKGTRGSKEIIKGIKQHIKSNTHARINYVDCVSAIDLTPLKRIKGKVLIALSASFGKTKLIDNIIVNT